MDEVLDASRMVKARYPIERILDRDQARLRAMIGRLLAGTMVALVPLAAGAHSDHGDVKRLGSQSVVTVAGDQVEILSHPSPLARGRASQVVARVFTTASWPCCP